MNEDRPLTVEEALSTVVENAHALPSEDVPLLAAHGRYLSERVLAALALPPFTNSAMDGYALQHPDTPGRLEVIGESAAGAPFRGHLGRGQAVTISTGAPLPDGADAVVPVERVEILEGGRAIRVPRSVPRDHSIRHAGSDVKEGTEVLAAGARIGPAQIGAAASLGVERLRCAALPRVAVLTTGSELRSPGQPLGAGQIYDSNGPLLGALLSSAGVAVTTLRRARDTREAHREAISRALTHDVVISTGGVSVGAHDLVREVERELGVRELFWRVALKPGKPLSFGTRERTMCFGIPGNPVSVLVCFELFVRPALAALQGARHPGPAFVRRTLTAPVELSADREQMIRVRVNLDGGLEPLAGQQSHQLALSAQADGLARIPAGAGTLSAGAEVSYLPLTGASWAAPLSSRA